MFSFVVISTLLNKNNFQLIVTKESLTLLKSGYFQMALKELKSTNNLYTYQTDLKLNCQRDTFPGLLIQPNRMPTC